MLVSPMRPRALIVAALLLSISLSFGTKAALPSPRLSGFDQMSPAVQALQRDDAQNPAMLWVKGGEAAWREVPPASNGISQKSCEGCHGDAAKTMRGVSAQYPRYSEPAKKPLTLAQQINVCRVERQQQTVLSNENEKMLQLLSYVGLQSRGMPVVPSTDERVGPFQARGESIFKRRIGQLDLSCAHCHDERSGLKLGGSIIPQGHANAYPIYRLEWQGVGSLQRRLRNCMVGVRAQPFAEQAIEWTELELYLNVRAAGMAVETPGVRP